MSFEIAPLTALLVGGASLGWFWLRRPRSPSPPERPRGASWPLLVASLLAAFLSGFWVVHYLRGGPRIVDATSYFAEARLLSQGRLTAPLADPSASLMGRFWVRNEVGDAMAPIFPPGYPAFLAVGFWLGEPMMMGPILAGLVTLATALLAREAFPGRPDIVKLAAVLSTLSATLRYHTADTMSHGWVALLFALGLAALLRGRRGSTRSIIVYGTCVGLSVLARPVSGAVLAVMGVFVMRRDLRRLSWGLAAGAPWVGLLVAQQSIVTGVAGASTQTAYYLTSDGPLGCFRYGFGRGIGCHFEHGTFVEHNLPRGYDGWAALKTTARRLHMHLGDATNTSLGAALWLLAAAKSLRAKGPARVLAAGPLVLVLAYSPFYFDGNYPGGGARFFVDGLPFEHVLLAWWLCDLGALGQRSRTSLLVAWMSLGFAFESHRDHELLRDREGGLPMFEARLAEEGLLFVNTDHGFSLGFDAEAPCGSVARLRNDATDFFAANRCGRPSFRYEYDPTSGRTEVTPYVPVATPTLRPSSLWPPLEQHGAYAFPVFDGDVPALRIVGENTGGYVLLPIPCELSTAPFSLRSSVELTAFMVEGRCALRVELPSETPVSEASVLGIDFELRTAH